MNNESYNLIYADRLSIIDTNKSGEIAFSKRYMGYHGIIGQISQAYGDFLLKIGISSPERFPRIVIFEYARYFS